MILGFEGMRRDVKREVRENRGGWMRVCMDDPCCGPFVGMGHLWVCTSYSVRWVQCPLGTVWCTQVQYTFLGSQCCINGFTSLRDRSCA